MTTQQAERLPGHLLRIGADDEGRLVQWNPGLYEEQGGEERGTHVAAGARTRVATRSRIIL